MMRYLLFALALIGTISAVMPTVTYADPGNKEQNDHGFHDPDCGHLGDGC
jgi:hypothetical protein